MGARDGQPVVSAAMDSRRRGLAFAVLTVAFAMDVIDTTIVNIAIPAIQSGLHASTVAVQWMVAGYSTAFAVLLITGGRMGDIFGYRRLFAIGMAGFTLASLLCGLAQSPTQLVIARLLQGGCAALMGPQVLALIQILYKPHERVRVLSFFGILGGLAAVLGPIIGGALIRSDLFGLGWRLIFLINLPVGIAGLLAAGRLLPRGRSPHPLKLDVVGAALVSLFVFVLVFPLIEDRALHWPAWIIAMLVATLPLGLTLVAHVRRRTARDGSALIEPSLFGDINFTNGLLMSVVFAVVTGGFFLVLTVSLQIGLGLDALSAALVHVPFAIGVGFGISVVGRRVLPRLGRNVLLAGAVLMATGLAALLYLVGTGAVHPVLLGAALLVAGLGMGMIVGPLSPIALSRVDVRHAGSASGLLKSSQQVGAAIGAALIGAIFFAPSGSGVDASATRHALVPATLAMLAGLAIVMLQSLAFTRRLFDEPPDTLKEATA